MTMLVDEESGLAFEVVGDDDAQNPLRQQTIEEATDPAPRTNVLVEPSQESEGEPAEGEGAESETTEEETPEAEAEVPDDEEFLELDEKLDAYLAEQLDERVKTATSGRDRQITAQAKQLEDLRAQQAQLQKDIREAKVTGLSPAEQEKARAMWADEDRRAAQDEYQQKLDSFYLDLKRIALAQDYSEFGVTAEDLESIIDEDEMEKFCDRAENAHWKAIAQGKKAPSASAAAAGAKPATPAKVAAVTRPVAKRPAPAGASAASDAGGGEAPAPPTRKPGEGVGIEAMAATFDSLPYANVRFRQ